MEGFGSELALGTFVVLVIKGVMDIVDVRDLKKRMQRLEIKLARWEGIKKGDDTNA